MQSKHRRRGALCRTGKQCKHRVLRMSQAGNQHWSPANEWPFATKRQPQARKSSVQQYELALLTVIL